MITFRLDNVTEQFLNILEGIVPQYTLHKQIGYGMRAERVIVVFVADNNASAFAQVARELNISLKNGALDEWEFYKADANNLFRDGIQIFPERPVFALINEVA
ncbi:MAG: hypothetical protein Q8P17_01910 [bacterium]|nr:hypothetical protein [bacterium]